MNADVRSHGGRGDAEVRLCYCSNVHPAEDVAGIEAALRDTAAKVRERLGLPVLGVGLWLPRRAVDELFEDAPRLAAFGANLAALGLETTTLNAFPYGGFHAARVKEAVFAPSWAERERLEYTRRCIGVLAELLPEGADGSLSTVPLGHPTFGFDRVLAVENLREAARICQRVERERGKRIVLAIEPEPAALLETVGDVIAFLDGEVFRDDDDPLRDWLGVCVDACHEAVLMQHGESSLERLAERRITVGKIQLSSALEVVDPLANRDGLERLAAFDEGRWLHQVAFRRPDGSLAVFPEVARFLEREDLAEELSGVERLRVHFHVPIDAVLTGPLRTTRPELERLVAAARRLRITTQYEVETYTFDVVPEAERDALGARDLPSLIARELALARSWLD
jgi:sugar phosphate isomerase/epimerase